MLPGLSTIGEAALAEQLEWPLKGFRKAFQEVLSQGLVKADWKARVLWVPNTVRYNEPESPNVVRSWAKHFLEIPECALKTEALISLREYVKRMDSSDGNGRKKQEAKDSFTEAFHEAFHEPLAKAFGEGYGESVAVTGAGAGAGTGERKDGLKPAESPVPSLPVESILERWTRIAEKLGLVVPRAVSKRRLEKLKSRLREHPNSEFWVEVFRKIEDSHFLQGENDRGWKIDFDFLIANTENVLKIVEGKYDGRNGTNGKQKENGLATADQLKEAGLL